MLAQVTSCVYSNSRMSLRNHYGKQAATLCALLGKENVKNISGFESTPRD